MNGFLKWIAGVLSDPTDQQGSTHRVLLALFLGTVMLLIITVTFTAKPIALPTIPASMLELIYTVTGILTTGIAVGKGVAAWKEKPTAPTGDSNVQPAADQVQ